MHCPAGYWAHPFQPHSNLDYSPGNLPQEGSTIQLRKVGIGVRTSKSLVLKLSVLEGEHILKFVCIRKIVWAVLYIYIKGDMT